jgi:hypothetical protein
MGEETVRPPRLKLEGSERELALRIIGDALASRPEVS